MKTMIQFFIVLFKKAPINSSLALMMLIILYTTLLYIGLLSETPSFSSKRDFTLLGFCQFFLLSCWGPQLKSLLYSNFNALLPNFRIKFTLFLCLVLSITALLPTVIGMFFLNFSIELSLSLTLLALLLLVSSLISIQLSSIGIFVLMFWIIGQSTALKKNPDFLAYHLFDLPPIQWLPVMIVLTSIIGYYAIFIAKRKPTTQTSKIDDEVKFNHNSSKQLFIGLTMFKLRLKFKLLQYIQQVARCRLSVSMWSTQLKSMTLIRVILTVLIVASVIFNTQFIPGFVEGFIGDKQFESNVVYRNTIIILSVFLILLFASFDISTLTRYKSALTYTWLKEPENDLKKFLKRFSLVLSRRIAMESVLTFIIYSFTIYHISISEQFTINALIAFWFFKLTTISMAAIIVRYELGRSATSIFSLLLGSLSILWGVTTVLKWPHTEWILLAGATSAIFSLIVIYNLFINRDSVTY